MIALLTWLGNRILWLRNQWYALFVWLGAVILGVSFLLLHDWIPKETMELVNRMLFAILVVAGAWLAWDYGLLILVKLDQLRWLLQMQMLRAQCKTDMGRELVDRIYKSESEAAGILLKLEEEPK